MNIHHQTQKTVSGQAGQKHETPNYLKQLLVGIALTGAKYTPNHHKGNGKEIDKILRGDFISTDLEEAKQEIAGLYGMGLRYFHWHARNPDTREQSCGSAIYQRFGRLIRSALPDIVLSYGGSRNGSEIAEALRQEGEWIRLCHAALSREEGGADFVTIQAAAELAIIIDMERQGYLKHFPERDIIITLKSLDDYVASSKVESLAIKAHSTAGGANYGSSSAQQQLEVFQRAIESRGQAGLPQEVEWTQLERSYALTKVAVKHLNPGLANTGRLNITILFGFSPKMPFPLTYADFQYAVELARSIEKVSPRPLNLSISVGAAVLPQQAKDLSVPLDIGPYKGETVSPLERLVAYTCQLDSDVDLLRCGLEDTPYLLNKGEIVAATNSEVAAFTLQMIEKHGGQVTTDPSIVRKFVETGEVKR